MAFTEKIYVLELIISLLKENETKLESLIEKMEIIDQTLQKDPIISKTVKEYDSSTHEKSISYNILVVDDDRNLANSFKLILESVGYSVDTAFTGLQALYMVNKQDYDLVLLDLNLPDVMGDEVAEKIEETHGHIDIIFITGHSMLKTEVESHLDEKMVLMKPIAPETLLKIATKKIRI
jgi:CheY-like chemotaxis protein